MDTSEIEKDEVFKICNIQDLQSIKKIKENLFLTKDSRDYCRFVNTFTKKVSDELLIKTRKEIENGVFLLRCYETYSDNGDCLLINTETMTTSSCFEDLKNIKNGIFILTCLEGDSNGNHRLINIKIMKESGLFETKKSFRDGVVLLTGEGGDSAFLNTITMKESSWFTRKTDFGNGIFLVKDFFDYFEFIKIPRMERSNTFSTKEDLGNGIFLLKGSDDVKYKKFFNLSTMEKTDWLSFETQENLGNGVFKLTSRAGQTAELSTVGMKLSPWT